MTTVTFKPEKGTSLLHVARAFEDNCNMAQECIGDPHAASYAYGCIEGEMAFALAVASANPYSISVVGALQRCQQATLLRLGLADSPLTLEQERLKGWLVGLFGVLIESLTPDSEPHAQALAAA